MRRNPTESRRRIVGATIAGGLVRGLVAARLSGAASALATSAASSLTHAAEGRPAGAASSLTHAAEGRPAGAASSWPDRPVRLIVPFAPGGAADPLARLIGERLAVRIGQAVVVENHPGANGNIGSELTARANPDGYTLMMAAASTLTINPHIYAHMPFDPTADFAPVGIVAIETLLLVANPGFPADNVQELIALARQRPGRINYGSGGSGSAGHLAMELLKSMTGVDIVHVPYKSAGSVLPGLLSGEVSLLITSASAVLAPAKTPPALVARIDGELRAVMNEPSVQERIARMGLAAHAGTPAELAERISKDSAKWAPVVKAANIKVD